MDRDDDEVLAHLRAENEYLAEVLAPLKPLEERALRRDQGAASKRPTSRCPCGAARWWYFERTREGLNYPDQLPRAGDGRRPHAPVIDPLRTLAGEQVILDENAEAEGHDFLSVGVLAVSPDDGWVAVGTDVEGGERHRVTVRPLAGQAPVDDVLEDVYYGFAWANDSRHFFYTRVDDAMRPVAALAPRAGHARGRRRPGAPGGRRPVHRCRSGAAATTRCIVVHRRLVDDDRGALPARATSPTGSASAARGAPPRRRVRRRALPDRAGHAAGGSR